VKLSTALIGLDADRGVPVSADARESNRVQAVGIRARSRFLHRTATARHDVQYSEADCASTSRTRSIVSASASIAAHWSTPVVSARRRSMTVRCPASLRDMRSRASLTPSPVVDARACARRNGKPVKPCGTVCVSTSPVGPICTSAAPIARVQVRAASVIELSEQHESFQARAVGRDADAVERDGSSPVRDTVRHLQLAVEDTDRDTVPVNDEHSGANGEGRESRGEVAGHAAGVRPRARDRCGRKTYFWRSHRDRGAVCPAFALRRTR
jgi:hypothetical protein